MKLGISAALTHSSPEEWARRHRELGLESVVFPVTHLAEVRLIDAYQQAARAYGLRIAEVGVWRNPFDPDPAKREENSRYCLRQLELAEYVGAACCVNISGAKGPVWDGGYAENYSEKTHDEIVEFVRWLIDSVRPERTFYTLEPMPWMLPDSPESCLTLMKDVDRPAFAVHMDMVNMISDPKKYLMNREFTNRAFDLLGRNIKSCHLKDTVMDTRLTVHLQETACGQGGFDIANYIRRIDELDPDMPVIIEHLSREEDYIQAVRFIRRLEEEMKHEKA